MITRKQIEEILDDTLEGDNPPDSAPTVVGKQECVNRLMELVKNCSIPVVSKSVKLGDKVKIIANTSGHEFSIGDYGVANFETDTDWEIYANGETWNLKEHEFTVC